ncbi:AAA family ATPase [Magnetovibrio sp. PR-2]|uniref:nucleotide-binding protein n=1 Tax=Magnetovibrio sp. PR-2 TaxID=3120356 RepID=UPI002FCDE86D
MTRLIMTHAQKGGSGKTTMSANLYTCAVYDGISSAIFDLDPQSSIIRRFEKRDNTVADLLFGDVPRSMAISDVVRSVKNTNKDLVFLDTEPRSSERYQELAGHSDLIVVPIRPTVLDLEAAGDTYTILKNADALERTVFVISQAPAKRGMAENPDTLEALEILRRYGLTVAPTIIRNRRDYSRSLNDGYGVLEAAPKSKAADEIRNLWNFIKERI